MSLPIRTFLEYFNGDPMHRIGLLVLAAICVSLCCSVLSKSTGNDSLNTSSGLQESDNSNVDGVYRFVSDTTTYVLPDRATEARDDSNWKGFWIFKDGYFSKTIVRNERPEWTPEKFPSDARGTGFDGGVGKYNTNGHELTLTYEITYYPGMSSEVEYFNFQLKEGLLTLTRAFTPSRESAAKGEQVVVLQRVP